MTTARFCHQCGKDVEGAAFCPHCGAAQVVAPPPAVMQTPPPVPVAPAAATAPLNAFCPNCGTKAEPGLAFCTSCGADLATGVPLAPSQYVQPVAAESKTPIYVGVGAVVVALIIAIVVLSGGGDEDSSNGSNSATSGLSDGRQTSTVTTNAPKPANSADVASLPKPEPITSSNSSADAQLGSQDRKTSKAVTDALTVAKVDLKGTQIFVYPVYGTKESLLVFDIDGSVASNTTTGQEQMLKTLSNIPALKTANINRVVMNYKGKDKQGNYLMTVTLTLTALDAMNRGTMPQAEMQKQMLGEVKRLP